jgi:hypothetical protein
MRLKKTKEEVLSEIYSRASGAVSSELYSGSFRMDINTNSITDSIQRAVARAVQDGFRTLLENQYTDDDFEKDLQLK